MQSASRSGFFDSNEYVPTRWETLMEQAREWMGGGRLGAAIFVLLLTLTIAKSTSTAEWVDGIDVIVPLALLAAVLMGGLAILPVNEPIALGVGFLLAPAAAALAAWPQLHARHHSDVFGPQLVGVWWHRINDGTATSDPTFYLLLICLLMWFTGGWLAWCVLRWRKPMLGLIPGAAAFATNVLNLPQNQNFYTLAIVVLTLGLLLWTNYTGSIAEATHAHVKLSGDARWDFWESGLVAMAALILVSLLAPPLSTVDRTLDLESGIFTSWAQLQQELSHPGFFSGSAGAGGVTGFSQDVTLSGWLHKSREVVFTYTIVGDYGSSARYFRGLSETLNIGSQWRYANGNGLLVTVPRNQSPTFAESDQKQGFAAFNVRMVRPPIGNADILFYPGNFYRVDRPSAAKQVRLNFIEPSGALYSVDRLSSLQPPTAAGNYSITVGYSDAAVSDYETAGTSYPAWVAQFSSLPRFGYRNPTVLTRIHNLALDIVQKAGATNPYDEAIAIETYLRDSNRFKYSLDAVPPAGVDPIEWFLFDSQTGYCEFFASAMGDMLRSLGIPTRLVNGFGPGNFEPTVGAYVVRGEDAHTWVEVYFPAPAGSTQPYGWIPFEPTADGTYFSISRGTTGTNLCLSDFGCDASSVGAAAAPTATPKVKAIGGADIGAGPTGGGLGVGVLTASALTTVLAIAIALLLLLLVATSRYLRPRTVMAVWKRMLVLTRLAGAERPPGETPLELGRRLQRSFPEASEPLGTLTNSFTVAAYAPPEVAPGARASVMEAWSALRPMLLRRVFRRLSPTRP